MLVTEATFARHVLRAELPVLVCFGARACPGRLALRPALERVGAARQGLLLVATALTDRAPLLVEQYGVVASPTLMVFTHGDRQGQVVGFISQGLLDLLADDVIRGAVAGDTFWSPVEERFEDAALIPLLQGWGLGVERQVACALPGANKAQRGRIDLLVYDRPGGPPLTLIESKRQIRGDDDLRQAAFQAAAYARSLALASFVVAAPRGLWVYRCDGGRPRCARHFTSLELHEAPERLRQLLLQLRPPAAAP
jgi:thioredoxin 1